MRTMSDEFEHAACSTTTPTGATMRLFSLSARVHAMSQPGQSEATAAV
ncbi:MAG: hypothetical protein WCH20_16580 [Nitrospira sp.]